MRTAFCPVCGYELTFLPWKNDSPADEICSCCGIQFGYDDIYADSEDDFKKVYEDWRKEWISHGSIWFSNNPPPVGWNAQEQIQNYLLKQVKVLHIRGSKALKK